MQQSSISYGVVNEVAQAKGVEPAELRPLHDVIDPDALESLFDETDGARLREGHVSFSYEGFLVHIEDDGSIAVTERGEP